MNVPLVDLSEQYSSIQKEVDEAIKRVIGKSAFILGQEVEDFERQFADFCGAKHCVGVASGTAALHLALLACGIGPGDEVITTPFTFIATAEAISHCGARPVFVDIDPRTYNIDPAKIEPAITDRTKALVPVHLYGQAADMDPILATAHRYGLKVIEDAAQAHGARYKGQRVGTLGDAVCFSFYPGKNLGAYGDGGAVVTNDVEIADRVRMLRNHGRTGKYEHLQVGYGERLDALQAAILGVKLRYLEAWNQARRVHALRYGQLFEGHGVEAPYQAPWGDHVYHLYVIRTSRRDDLRRHLGSKGIAAGVHYPLPLHRQPAYLKLGYGDVRLPISEQAASQVLSLPIYAELTDEQISYVVATIQEYLPC